MKRTLVIFLLLAAYCAGLAALPTGHYAKDSCWSKEVKTVLLEKNGTALGRPYLRLNGQDRAWLRFDVLESTPRHFSYRIQHCDRNWRVDDLQPSDYLNGFEEAHINTYQNSFITLQQYVNYSQTLPEANSDFLLSGNYVVSVFPQGNPDSVVLTCRFCVYEELLNATVTVNRPMSGEGDLIRDQEVSVSLTPSTGVFIPNATQCIEVRVQQNGRLDAIHTLPFSGYDGSSLLYRWKKENVFAGGNCFRYFDLSNLRSEMYNVQELQRYAGENFAILRPEEDKSKKVFVYEASLNGGMKINAFDRNNVNTEADYVWVSFSLPRERPFLDGNVYVVGDLTQWKFNDDSRMEYDAKYHAYTKRMLLKQGYYAYQLLFLPIGGKRALSATLEGDHYETPNNYTAFAYLRLPNDRADRLAAIGFNK
ncbi:MAG: DUF5103 domain-containing protein [Bacteroidales bacterium]|nr:DUF5103 domain-containing protein [Bacteroidales bacterium]